MFGCFGNMCTCIYCVLYCFVYVCMYIYIYIYIYIYSYLLLVYGLLSPSENSIAVNNNNNNNYYYLLPTRFGRFCKSTLMMSQKRSKRVGI